MDEWTASGILVVMLSLNKKWIKSIYYMIFLSSLFGHLGNLGFKGYSTYFFLPYFDFRQVSMHLYSKTQVVINLCFRYLAIMAFKAHITVAWALEANRLNCYIHLAFPHFGIGDNLYITVLYQATKTNLILCISKHSIQKLFARLHCVIVRLKSYQHIGNIQNALFV